ncbi:hypothetical protein LCGC14_1302100 [marine sediment metagenome]|uniref:Uncharacterized protein n=1 Tax=marine sediment metagenome TaxID=412755 RepID=A0A0F9KPM6_9ZZZZ
MPHKWPGGFTLQFWSPKEFKRSELMDSDFLKDLDYLRMKCGFPLRMNNDARTQEDLERIYAKEISKGQHYPTDSSHLYIEGNVEFEEEEVKVRAGDIEPSIPRPGDGSDFTLEKRELKLLLEILKMWEEGRWPKLGLGIETGHTHVDDTPRLGDRRPAHWVAVSK